jgi:hypothetical protein
MFLEDFTTLNLARYKERIAELWQQKRIKRKQLCDKITQTEYVGA